MSTNLNERIIQVIDSSEELIKQGIDFTKEQAPLVVQEFLTWGYVSNLIVVIVCFCFMVLTLVGLWKCYKVFKKNEDNCIPTVLCFVLGFALVMMTFQFAESGKTCLKIKYAPRVYLIEQVTK